MLNWLARFFKTKAKKINGITVIADEGYYIEVDRTEAIKANWPLIQKLNKSAK